MNSMWKIYFQLYDLFRIEHYDGGAEKSSKIETEENSKKLLYDGYERDVEKAKEVRKEMEKVRQKVELKMDSFAEQKSDEIGHRVDAFMDEIEGETLGQGSDVQNFFCYNYLSDSAVNFGSIWGYMILHLK